MKLKSAKKMLRSNYFMINDYIDPRVASKTWTATECALYNSYVKPVTEVIYVEICKI